MKTDRLTLLFIILSAITIFLWALGLNFQFDPNRLVSYLGQIAGLMTILCMSLDYITSTRLRVIENFAGGLDITYRFHGWIGKLAAVFIIGHPLFLMLQRFTGVESILRYFWPGNIEFFNWGIFSFWILILLVVLTVFVKMEYRLWKILHRFMILTFVFGAYHIFLDYTNPTRSPGIDLKEAWVFAFIFLGLLSFFYRDFIYPFLAHYYKVVKVQTIGLVTEVYMEPVSKPMKFRAGQYVFMSVMNNKQLSQEAHPFGITSSPNDRVLRVSIKHLGNYTKNAGLINPGDKVKLWGPNGKFTWDDFNQSKKQIWIAGGIGIAPFLSMCKYALEIKAEHDIHLFYVEKNESECEYNSELKELLKDQNIIKLYNHYDEDLGHITAQAVKEKVGGLSDAVVLICGPDAMESALRKQFVEIGLKDEMIKAEDFQMKK